MSIIDFRLSRRRQGKVLKYAGNAVIDITNDGYYLDLIDETESSIDLPYLEVVLYKWLQAEGIL